MSPRDKFDRVMLEIRNGTNFKLARLSHAHYRAFFSAVVPIAALSDVRGAFMVHGLPATVEDMRLMSPKLSVTECRSALTVFRDLGMLETDDDGIEWVHDFEEWNPAPKRDVTSAERQQRHRDKQRRNGRVTRDVTRDTPRDVTRDNRDSNALAREEVEVEVEDPPAPVTGGARVLRFDRKPVPDHRRQLAERIHDEFNRQAGTRYQPYTGDGKPSEGLRRIVGALTAHPAVDFDQAAAAIRWQLARPYWGDAAPKPGNVFGPNVFPGALESSGDARPSDSTSDFIARMNRRTPTSPASNGDAA